MDSILARPDWQRTTSRGWNTIDAVLTRDSGLAARTLADQVAIARVPAPTGHEGARAAMLSSTLRERLGDHAQVTQDAAGNVVMRLAGAENAAARAPLVLMAHLDTVFDLSTPLAPRREGSVVHCPGIGDNGRGLAAVLTIAGLLRVAELREMQSRPIELVATVGEEGEGNLQGARYYFDALEARDGDGPRAAPPHAVLVLDGPGDGTIVHHAIASERLRVSLQGTGGHSWVDSRVPNPVHAAGIAIAAVARLSARAASGTSIAVTRMGGGEGLTSIPESAWFDVDMRSRDVVALARLRIAVERIARDAAQGVTVHVTSLGARPGGALASSHPLVALAARATEWCGVSPVAAMASTDANIPLSRGIPAITIGAGGTGGRAHSLDEWYDDTNGARGIARALGMTVALAAD